jgi:predicted RNA-binding Zn ribbon-like protein
VRGNDLEFVFTGGCAPLDLVATLGRRRSAVPVERLTDRAALTRWLVESGQARTIPEATAVELEQARRLREAIYCLVRPHIGADPPSGPEVDDALATLNHTAARPALGDRLVATAAGLHAEPVEGTAAEALARIAREAVHLLGGPRVHRVRECEHPDCSLLFLDETQARRRRWCSMQRCGNLVKVAGYRGRRRSRPAQS